MGPIFSPAPRVAPGPARRPERSSTPIVRRAKSLTNELRAAGLPGQVVALITHVAVSAVDPAFQDPCKPIGSVYTQEAERLRRVEGWPIAEDAGRGWRRVVPSPRPEALQARGQFPPGSMGAKLEAALRFVRSGGRAALITHVAVSAVDPAFQDPCKLIGSVYAQEAERLPRVEGWPIAEDAGRGWRRVVPSPRPEALQARGQFPPGSMGAKLEAALRFVRSSGRAALITSVAWGLEAVRGGSGTRLVADEDRLVA